MIKKVLRNIQYSFNDIINFKRDVIRADWYGGDYNFGDILNPIILENISGRKVLNINSRYYEKEHLLAIGSILDRATSRSLVWGSGFISATSVCLEKPKKIFAVRGPRTRKRLLELGVDCPDVYGDPALLMAVYYQTQNAEKKFRLGILPHYVDKENPWLWEQRKKEDVAIIDVQNSSPLEVIDQIVSCERIISSSLHGIIISDTYKIPSLWVEFSDKVTGNGFKFMDYFESVGREDDEPVRIGNATRISELYRNFSQYSIFFDSNRLVKEFPY